MFSSIAHRYDILNRLLSFGRDQYWRRFAVKQLSNEKNGKFLDVATGTGDVAIEIVKQHARNARVIGVDFSEQMLERGREKISTMGYEGLITFQYGDGTSLPFGDNTFNASIIAFGIRNIPDYHKGIQEMARVVKDGGKVIILEFTSAQSRFFQWLFRFYLKKVLPFIGGLISGRKSAYTYLSRSVMDFPNPEELKKIMEESGLKKVTYYPLTFSIVTVHVGTK
jgi:demethylmenaquinone methyltransferase/2-methoxy-6-polyprenyl-1,4-benzoquinol methylase